MTVSEKFRCVIIGEGTLPIRCAEILMERGHQIGGIISSDALTRRWANDRLVPLIDPAADLPALLSQQPFDCLFSIANERIVSAEVLQLPRKCAINYHDSLLPRYSGFHATSWAIMQRETIHGVTWHAMGTQVDAGDILKQELIEIAADESAFSLNAKCYEAAIRTFAELIDDLSSGHASAREQTPDELTYCPKYRRPAAASVLSWNQSAHQIDAFVRALNFGHYANPLGLPKLVLESEFLIVSQIDVLDAPSTSAPGTITAIEPDLLRIATASLDVEVREVLTVDGQPVSIPDVVARHQLHVGCSLSDLGAEEVRQITAINESICRQEAFWAKKLAALEPIALPCVGRTSSMAETSRYVRLTAELPAELQALLSDWREHDRIDQFLLAAFGAYLAHIGGTSQFDISFRECRQWSERSSLEGLFASHVPLRLEIDSTHSFTDVLAEVRAQTEQVRSGRTYARDVVSRYPELRSRAGLGHRLTLPVTVEWVERLDEYEPIPGSEFALVVSGSDSDFVWVFDAEALDEDSVASLLHQFTTFLRGIGVDPSRRIAELPLLTDGERHQLLVDWNDCATEFPTDQCVHQLFEAAVREMPDSVAVVFRDQHLTYRELNVRANQLAHSLRKLGVGPEILVGVHMDRSLEMMVGLLGILKAGGAYVPLDPEYPSERLAFMIEDAEVPVLLTQERLLQRLPVHGAQVVCLDTGWEEIAREREANVDSGVTPENLAYVIYTSGSTGKPKGVMVEHRNVVNFFTGMDNAIGSRTPGIWLAVTSISFDISVLELFWTLARGYEVILHGEKESSLASIGSDVTPGSQATDRPIEFSLFYFASDAGEGGADKYRLLIEGAKFADRHDFSAVWTPERHFHAFGGLYPNPSVASAAIAMVTERIAIRAGSVVMPLQSPIRVAEEWAVVDNLSKGRVAISFASGWQPNDFVLAPGNYAARKELMFRQIETVRQLWRGEPACFVNGIGQEVEIGTLPRPIQRELPIWITAAGNPETFRMAGEFGANLLTHLLGQRVEELAEKIAIYREAWDASGHAPGEGRVTLMLHTFVGEDLDAVREKVRQPFCNYLRSSVELIQKLPSAFPTFVPPSRSAARELDRALATSEFSEADMEALLSHAFERYFETSGLFGTPETCLQMIDRLKKIGVDEVACLVDFGVDADAVLASLDHLNRVRELSNKAGVAGDEEYSLPAEIRRHRVSHLQCTPSLARMLTAHPDSVQALRSLQKLMLGGEALPVSLVEQLQEVVPGEIHNMYGPTETTIWSTTQRLDTVGATVPIGRPIANTEIYILDRYLRPVPVGVPGELFIGGAGVVRGYLHRPELTAERFIPHPFRDEPGARLYRTGDLACYQPDGTIEFLGRLDHQVKIRGYRIELGEIEAALEQQPSLREAVVVAREDTPGDKRLVAYLAVRRGPAPSIEQLRTLLKEKLPDYMVPSAFVFLEALPLTPNGKVDRGALPAPDAERPDVGATFVAPRTPMEKGLAEIWAEALGVERIGVLDDFFSLGGHSLTAVQIAFRIRQSFHVDLPLQTFFRVPTIAGLAERLEASALEQVESPENGTARAGGRDEVKRAAEMLEEVVRLSPAEVRALLDANRALDGSGGRK